ncbi:LysR substrate-binding domain-containing protein [Comamonas testosteroni]|uniref:LysR substrate-binding domain-containing protein n=1 Tax=Comamonas testosteroni TaxID=285 RepID=UPI002DB98582|nr:LysR substrate-binding domain-containing protein [Comamonas testosteroni]MEB5967392.1 LysR substrate-binding domain-containing protein [Comamonas testosteroni]
MELRQLRYFLTVVEERNFSRAAARLHMTQPPLTRQIALLEEELGVRLLDRTSRGVELTAAGSVFYDEICNVKVLVEQAAERAQRTSRGLAGILEVGFFGSGALVIVPEILKRFTAVFPDVGISLLNSPQMSQLQALRQKRLLITFDRWIPRDSDLEVETLVNEALYVAIHDRSPLASEHAIKLSSLSGEYFIAPRDLGHYTWMLGLCRDNGFAPRESQKAADMVSGLTMVACGFGCQIVPESICALSLPGVIYRPLQVRIDATMPLECAYIKGEGSPLLNSILEIARSYQVSPALSAQRRVRF